MKRKKWDWSEISHRPKLLIIFRLVTCKSTCEMIIFLFFWCLLYFIIINLLRWVRDLGTHSGAYCALFQDLFRRFPPHPHQYYRLYSKVSKWLIEIMLHVCNGIILEVFSIWPLKVNNNTVGFLFEFRETQPRYNRSKANICLSFA